MYLSFRVNPEHSGGIEKSCFIIQSKISPLHLRRAPISVDMTGTLAASRHTIEIKSLEVYHGFCNIVLFLSFFKKSAWIEYSLFYKWIYIFGWEFFLWKSLLILHIPSSLLVWEIESWLLIFIPCIGNSCFFLSFWKLSSSCLFFYDAGLESVRICHVIVW